MALIADVRYGSIEIKNVYIRLHNVSGTHVNSAKDVAFYSIALFDQKDGSEVPLLSIEARNFTFGEPRRHEGQAVNGLPSFRIDENPWRQCYEDLKVRFLLGLLPWASDLREEDGSRVSGIEEKTASVSQE